MCVNDEYVKCTTRDVVYMLSCVVHRHSVFCKVGAAFTSVQNRLIRVATACCVCEHFHYMCEAPLQDHKLVSSLILHSTTGGAVQPNQYHLPKLANSVLHPTHRRFFHKICYKVVEKDSVLFTQLISHENKT